jgi:hypothetical protein
LMPLIFCGSGGFHHTRTAVELRGSARTFTGGASGTEIQITATYFKAYNSCTFCSVFSNLYWMHFLLDYSIRWGFHYTVSHSTLTLKYVLQLFHSHFSLSLQLKFSMWRLVTINVLA